MSFPYTMRGKPSEILGVEVDQRLQELADEFALAWKLQGSSRPSPKLMERELLGGKGKAAFWPRMDDLLAWRQREGFLRQPPKEKWDEVELPEEEAKRRGVGSEPIGDQRELSPEVAYLEDLAGRADIPLDIFARFQHMRRMFSMVEEWEAAGWEKSHAEIRREWIRAVHVVVTEALGEKPRKTRFYDVVEAACPEGIPVPSRDTIKNDLRLVTP
jgi:hypothetical protein